ncbi:hypothetical protein B0H10DRAFT_2300958 [Mycena sp. CBHHK59/15]|nr:hypothetical protein B0H10DRAFT_2300958 [Mycena sp. CBHHK59/15]
MPGTRVGVLMELMSWAVDPRSPPIYWLTGMAGAGKSAIARSFAALLDRNMLLGASFFCSRASESRSQVAGILPSIAFQLAWNYPPYAQRTIDAITNAPGSNFNSRPPAVQFKSLTIQPSQALVSDHSPVVVIDALDECSAVDAVRELLDALIKSSRSMEAFRMKFFITSRPETHIAKAFDPDIVAGRLHLRDVEPDIVGGDIRRYLKRNLGIISQRTASPRWPSETLMNTLVQRTGKLFIFAFTVVQYLSPESLTHDEVQVRLLNILSGSSNLHTQGIDFLYEQIIEAAWKGKEASEISARRHALSTIICLRQPLSLDGIARLLESKGPDLKHLLADFHSILDIPNSDDSPVLIYHASFPDYMTNPMHSLQNSVDTSLHHGDLALRCIKCMNLLLHQDMCNMNRADSIPKDVDRSILAHL